MKTFLKFLLLLALALPFPLRASTNDVATLSGTVVDAQGNPVTDATVVGYQYASRAGFGPMEMEAKQHATTDRQGAFEFPAFRGMGVVLVTKTGSAPAWRTWYSTPLESQKIVLGASSTLAGVVVDDAGRPVADAEVWVSSALNKATTDLERPNYLFGKIPRELFSARASAQGKFRIENFPADAQARLSVKAAGKALRQTANSVRYDELPFHAGQEDITLILDPAGSVTGKVVVRGTGQPLASAVVGLQPSAPAPETRYGLREMGTVASDVDGSFRIPDVPAGSYQVMANFTNEPIPDWVADPVPVTVAAGETVPDVQVQAYKGGVLEVTVCRKDNHEPLADAGVSVNSDDYHRGGSTGPGGVAYFRLPPGQYTVFANKPDWSQARAQATATDGQTTQATIELPAPFKVGGVVRDASGAPVAGASVGVFPSYSGPDTGARTDPNGHYELTWQKPAGLGSPEQNFHLLARHAGRKLAAMVEMDETTTNLDVILEPAMTVSGSVQDAKGNAVTNAVASIALLQDNSSFSISRQPMRSDEQGRILAEALPRGQRYGWYVSANGYGSDRNAMDAADPKTDHYDFPPLILKRADRKLAGRILGTNGKPVAGVQVWMSGESQPTGRANTDVDGRFRFDAVCDGAVSVSANFKGAYGSAEAMGGDTNVVIRFDIRNQVYIPAPPKTLTGTVFDPSGNHAIGARVVVTPSWGAADDARTDADGEYSVNWQAQPGMRDAKYFVVARDVQKNLAAIEAIGDQPTRVNLRLEPGLSLSGTVHDTKGAPLSQANINLNIMAGNMGGLVEYGRIRLNSEGAFTIPALPRGQQYLLFVNARGYSSAQKRVGKSQSLTNRIQLAPFTLKPADRQLAGQVLGADNKPLSGAYVNINGQSQPNDHTTTDATGHFKFKVCDGPVEIYVWSPDGPDRNRYANWYARGGDTEVVVKMGVRQPQREIIARETPLKPRPWTFSALLAWPANHKTGTIILLSLQAALLLGTGGGVFRLIRKHGQRDR